MAVIRIIRLALLFTSLLGYVWYLSKKIKSELALGVVFALVGSIMFLSGILNIMPYCAWTLFILGICCIYLSIKQKISVKNITSPGILFFLLMCAFFFVTLKGRLITGYDNFTHWAWAVQELIEYDRFANFTNPLDYYSYPLGSASFIYFVAEIYGGQSEWMQMFAQSMLTTAMAASLFAFAKDKKDNIVTGITAIMLLCSNIAFTDLLVDTLLSMIAVSAVSLCIYYKDEIADKIWYIVPHMVFVVSVKNSGTFFVVIILLYVLYATKKEKKSLTSWLCCALCPFAAIFLWQQHIKMTYGQGELHHYHTMTAENYKYMFDSKTTQEIEQIIGLIINKTISLKNTVLFILLFLILICIVNNLLLKNKNKTCNELVCFVAVSYAAYQLGIAAMYLFSMATSEALILASYDRYHRTILIFVAAVLLICVMKFDMGGIKLKSRYINVLFCIAFICTAFLSLKPNLYYYKPQQLSPNDKRAALHRLIEENNVEKEKRYLYVYSVDDIGYIRYLVNYELNSKLCTRTPLENFANNSEKYLEENDYLIVLDTQDEISEFFEEKYNVTAPAIIKISE